MKSRYRFLDLLRGLNLISMIAYHALYNLNYLYGHPMKWYRSTPGYIWQQSICWTFIFLSGFCLDSVNQNGPAGFRWDGEDQLAGRIQMNGTGNVCCVIGCYRQGPRIQ